MDLTLAVSQVAAAGLGTPDLCCWALTIRSKLASAEGPAWKGAVLRAAMLRPAPELLDPAPDGPAAGAAKMAPPLSPPSSFTSAEPADPPCPDVAEEPREASPRDVGSTATGWKI